MKEKLAPVAIKRLNVEDSDAEDNVHQLLKLKTLKHVLRYITIESTSDFVYLLMPLMEYNLVEIIEDKSSPFHPNNKNQVKMIIQFLTGLLELHRCGIIHRDLKPNNVLLGK